MRRRDVLRLGALALLPGCAPPPARPLFDAGTIPKVDPGKIFAKIRDEYFVEMLRRSPVVSTYLGGDGYSRALAGVNGTLRDWSPSGIRRDVEFLGAVRDALGHFEKASLSAGDRIDHAVISAQIAYMLHMIGEKRYQERSVETYSQEPFRGIDFHIQQMPEQGNGLLGESGDWDLVVKRVRAVPEYFARAQANLEAGLRSGNIPDRRMVKRDGIDSLQASVEYFRAELPAKAKSLLGDRAFGAAMLADLADAGEKAAAASAALAKFLADRYDLDEKADRFAIGEDEYRWRLGLLRIERTPAELFDYGARKVAEYQDQIFAATAEVARFEKITGLSFATPHDRRASARALSDHLEGKNPPESADELFRWYRETIDRAVAYARERGLFDVPAEYRIDVLPMPAVLGGGGASYYPAPPFRKSGVGRFYLGAPKDKAALAHESRPDVADTAVHEGFPGHDWNYKVMNGFAREISNVRWLTPGEVEGCFSMWEDSMATEGWALYAEELMAEPSPGKPHGFYSAAEHLGELYGQLYRAARVHVDVGIHTGRLSFDEAADFFLENVSFLDGTRAAASAGDPGAQRRVARAESAIYRYSKWPTQAITYELGKTAIESLRDRAKVMLGDRFDLKKFHTEFMRMGSIPPGLFADELLARLKAGVP